VDVLQERIRQKMEGRTDKNVYLRGDAGLLYQDLMEVFDRLNKAGITQVGLVSKLPGEK
jgi:biopolymer transport protein ExbD